MLEKGKSANINLPMKHHEQAGIIECRAKVCKHIERELAGVMARYGGHQYKQAAEGAQSKNYIH
jgi:hypothetical protein